MSRDQRKIDAWKNVQDGLSNENGLAVVVVDSESVVSASNNNSICEVLNSAPEYARLCSPFCGQAFNDAVSEGKPVSLKCHAGLNYTAVPIESEDKQMLVAIVGRTFLHSEDYRKATEKTISGIWKDLPADELFKNILISNSESEIAKLVKRLQKLSGDEKELLFSGDAEDHQESAEQSESRSEKTQISELSAMIEKFQAEQSRIGVVTEQLDEKFNEELEAVAEWRSRFGAFLEIEYKKAYISIADFLSERYQFTNCTWLENHENVLESVWAKGSFVGQQIQINISAADSRFQEVVQNETSLELRERAKKAEPGVKQGNINLFPIMLGGMVRSSLVIGSELTDSVTKRRISRFIKHVAPELEILRLREQIKQQSLMTKAVKRFNQTIKHIDKDDFWTVLLQNSAELMQAERGSILVLNEDNESFAVKEAVGNHSDLIKRISDETLGERVAKSVVRSGRPLIIRNAKKAGFVTATADRNYKTDSFICYPISFSGKKIGVINLADKIDGGFYDERDLEILHTLMPQIAMALDRTTLMQKAGEFEQLSITDPLTGLLNRRYLEERSTEELNRSQRHGYPMSFMMVDVDSFKSYNDTYGHPEGDKALQIVGQCLKATLRGADVAARYGGEEFSILLPQTTLSEAAMIAERLRDRVEQTEFPNRQVTVSIGIATYASEIKTTEALIAAADKALYHAKENGRNNVQVFSSLKKTENE